jgi:hypothetical protein
MLYKTERQLKKTYIDVITDFGCSSLREYENATLGTPTAREDASSVGPAPRLFETCPAVRALVVGDGHLRVALGTELQITGAFAHVTP